jgi:hypothetical protein
MDSRTRGSTALPRYADQPSRILATSLYLGHVGPDETEPEAKVGICDRVVRLPRGKLNLRECRFDTFYGAARVAKEMAAKQLPEMFSRDPYLQLENTIAGLGTILKQRGCTTLAETNLGRTL